MSFLREKKMLCKKSLPGMYPANRGEKGKQSNLKVAARLLEYF